MADLIEIDGSMGEGGGQVLRTSLGLSILTGRPLMISNIRASRKKPGLMRQHLTCVKAAARIGAAETEGAEISSQRLVFRPQMVVPGSYEFSIGTAGSTTLVLQAILPALICADGPSTIVVRGGTHNDMAPPWDFLDRVFFDALRKMGVGIKANLHEYGFFPAGGGCIEVSIDPVKKLKPFEFRHLGEIVTRKATILNSGLKGEIIQRERKTLEAKLGWRSSEIVTQEIRNSPGSGNILMLEVSDGHSRELVSAVAKRGKRAEHVAADACRDLHSYLKTGAPVGVHLADQLLIPMAMAGGGSFRCKRPTPHTRTNAEVISRFLDISFEFIEEEGRAVQIRLD